MERNSRELPPLESLVTKAEFESAKDDIWAELTRLDSSVAMVGNSYQLTYNDQFSNDELEGDAAPVDYFLDTQEEEYTQGVLEIETAQPTVSKSEEASLNQEPQAIAVKGVTNPELSKMIGVSERTIKDWCKTLKQGKTIGPSKHKDKIAQWKLGDDNLWYKKSE